ncbi:MAG: hypothetical protein LBI02_04130 [Opitutaceae bacterium]|nr:hypothetical protein [Opitutaceae bacterium]
MPQNPRQPPARALQGHPAWDTLFARLQTEPARQRETTATARRAAKDAALDAAHAGCAHAPRSAKKRRH